MDFIVWIYEHFDLIFYSNINVNITNFYTFIFKNYGACKMWLNSNGFNTFKINNSTHVQNVHNSKKWGIYELLHVFY